MALTEKQAGVVRGIRRAAGLMVVAFVMILIWQPRIPLSGDEMASRIAFALKADIVVILVLIVTIGSLARRRFFTPEDIDGGGLGTGSNRARVLQAILQNTLEQSLLAILAHLTFAVTAPIGWLGLVPTAVALFAIGRVLFWLGYAQGAPSRALGFGLTFYPSVLLTILAAIFQLMSVLA